MLGLEDGESGRVSGTQLPNEVQEQSWWEKQAWMGSLAGVEMGNLKTGERKTLTDFGGGKGSGCDRF